MPLKGTDLKLREQVQTTQQWNEELIWDNSCMKMIIDHLMMNWADLVEPKEWSQLKMKSILHPDKFLNGKQLKFEE